MSPPVWCTREPDVRQGLPTVSRIEEVLLIAGTAAPASWRVLHRLPLGATGSPVR